MGRAKRKIIGIVYQPDSNWIGGTYYIENLVASLLLCNDENLPIVKVYCLSKADYLQFAHRTNYPYLQMRLIQQYPLAYKWLRRISRIIFRHELPAPHLFGRKCEKDIFVYPTVSDNLIDKRKVLGWIPDFQEKHLPHNFSEQELKIREQKHKEFITSHTPVVLSSQDAQKDYHTFYPESRDIKTYVLPFAVTLPDVKGVNVDELKCKFGIKTEYLFCANQFWVHKNHLALFRAYKKAKDMGFDKQLVCTGKMFEPRNPNYISDIQNYIKENNLVDDILLLGFIDRKDQLGLLQNAYAVVQPSLFEGWSTIVEDAKSLNKFIFLSDIPVHREQKPLNVCYFNPTDDMDLAQKLISVTPTTYVADYRENIRTFGNTFLRIIEEINKI